LFVGEGLWDGACLIVVDGEVLSCFGGRRGREGGRGGCGGWGRRRRRRRAAEGVFE